MPKLMTTDEYINTLKEAVRLGQWMLSGFIPRPDQHAHYTEVMQAMTKALTLTPPTFEEEARAQRVLAAMKQVEALTDEGLGRTIEGATQYASISPYWASILHLSLDLKATRGKLRAATDTPPAPVPGDSFNG